MWPWVWYYSLEPGALTIVTQLKTVISPLSQNLFLAHRKKQRVESREPLLLLDWQLIWLIQYSANTGNYGLCELTITIVVWMQGMVFHNPSPYLLTFTCFPLFISSVFLNLRMGGISELFRIDPTFIMHFLYPGAAIQLSLCPFIEPGIHFCLWLKSQVFTRHLLFSSYS